MTFLQNTKPSTGLQDFFENLENFFSTHDLLIVVYGICADFEMLDENFTEAADMAVEYDWKMERTNIKRIELRRIKGKDA